MNKIRMLLVALVLATGIMATLASMGPSDTSSHPVVTKIASDHTPTPTPAGAPPGCGAGGC